MPEIRLNYVLGFFILLVGLSISCAEPWIESVPQDMFPSFSPDGAFIAYFHQESYPPDPNYPSGLYTMNKDGSNRQLVIQGEYINSPSWSPDSEWIAFSNSGVIQKCKTNGDSLETFSGLNNLENPAFFFPNWTRDGRYILFDKPFHPDGGLYCANGDLTAGNRVFQLVITEAGEPELSPNNFLLLYSGVGRDIERSEIFLTDTLGSAKIQLTKNKRDNRGPTWSPDGQRIVWSSGGRLCVMNVNGTDQHQIGYGNDPCWSINNEIVFSDANLDSTKEVLYIIDPDGKNKRQVTF